MRAAWKCGFSTLAIFGAAIVLQRVAASPPVLTASPGNPVLLMWPTNVPSFALQVRSSLATNASWGNWLAKPVAVGTNYVVTNIFGGPSLLFRLSNTPQLLCVNQLMQIGLGFKMWDLDNNGRFPFHVSTNQGGTWEPRAIGPDGFDTNSYLHFQVVSNEIVFPANLVCPGDISRVAAADFQSLMPQNVTYKVRSDDTVQDSDPAVILTVCPIDGNILYTDGSVTTGTNY